MMFLQEQRIAIVEFNFATKSHCRAISAFQQKYSGETAPNASTITRLVHIILEQPLHDEKLPVLCRTIELWGHFSLVALSIRLST
ncbi:hypothetical protein TNCT_536041 [Trichonephila clavata]|uniref:DUF4817 domain-containing protein n=1 Tax=Trichonephila clavata TaxID=2740835 RepID=A0A8X6JIK8_TRICU|nr:hypothetical protein TNCT_536041 [Trichonephila clavata]